MIKANNRSTRRTKALIQNAMLNLMIKKPYQLITVQEIIDEADICRTTFYAHYKDIYDLVESMESNLVAEIINELEMLIGRPYIEGQHPIFTSIVQVMNNHQEQLAILSGKNGDHGFWDKLAEEMGHVSRQITEKKYADYADEESLFLSSKFFVGGSISLLKGIMEHHIMWSPEKIAYTLGEVIIAGEKVFFTAQ